MALQVSKLAHSMRGVAVSGCKPCTDPNVGGRGATSQSTSLLCTNKSSFLKSKDTTCLASLNSKFIPSFPKSFKLSQHADQPHRRRTDKRMQPMASYLGKPEAAASHVTSVASEPAGGPTTLEQGDTQSLLVAIVLPLIAGAVISNFNSPLQKWYRDIKKPSWTPSDPVFGGAWSILYAVMGYSSWLVWRQGGWAAQALPLKVYSVQLVLNLLWPVLFFGMKKLGWAFLDISALLVAICCTISEFRPVNSFAAKLLLPYLAWVAFATALNYSIWRLNSGPSSGGDSYSGEMTNAAS